MWLIYLRSDRKIQKSYLERKNWLSILAKREIPQSRNCPWCDELIIN